MTTTTVETQLVAWRIDSPYAPLTIVGSTEGLRAILFRGDDPARVGLSGIPPRRGTVDPVDDAMQQLGEYSDGACTTFDLTRDLRGTDFQGQA